MGKRQHYVPQSYLHRFATDGRHVWAFDKQRRRWWLSSAREVCHENLFYQLRSPVAGEAVDKDWLEKRLSKLEDDLARLIQEVLAVPVGEKLDGRLCRDIVHALWLQLTRLPKARDFMLRHFAAHLTEWRASLGLPPAVARLARGLVASTVAPEYEAYWHCIALLGPHAASLAARLYGHVLQVAEAPAGAAFITSDSPVVIARRHPAGLKLWEPGEAMASPGAEVYYPISPKRCVVLYEPQGHHEDFLGRHGVIDGVSAELVDFANGLQLQQCERVVISRDCLKDWAAAALRRHPALEEPHRIPLPNRPRDEETPDAGCR